MITFYYEIKKQFKKTEFGFYKLEFKGEAETIHKHPASMHYAADRIWEEKDGTVSFIKNRLLSEEVDVDLEEFMWVKLAAKQL